MQQLSILMTNWQATTFLIGEYLDEIEVNPVFTIADGIVWLRQSVQRNSVVRKLEITKMRGQPTSPGLHSFRISLAGIKIFTQSPLAAQNQNENTWPIKVRQSMGIAGLDDMMDGGLPRGYSLLVAGPSGSGKSLLASAFLAAGAAIGETGVIAAFEQRANSSRGLAIADFIERDVIGVVKMRASNHSSALRLFYIDDDGLHIGEKLTKHEGLLSGRPTRRSGFESQLIGEVDGGL
jgi:circadian clock protein KaiC